MTPSHMALLTPETPVHPALGCAGEGLRNAASYLHSALKVLRCRATLTLRTPHKWGINRAYIFLVILRVLLGSSGHHRRGQCRAWGVPPPGCGVIAVALRVHGPRAL